MNHQEIEHKLLPHIDAAYNLAHWIVRNDQDAMDIVQEAYLKAFEFFDSLKGSDGKPWLLKIVRNTCYTWLHRTRNRKLTVEFDEELHPDTSEAENNPESLLSQQSDHLLIQASLESLSLEYREVIILREIEGMSYKEIAEITAIEIGTVMSRLSRGRKKLKELLLKRKAQENSNE